VRTLLSLRRSDDLLWITRPDDLNILPGGGPALVADLRETERKLRARGAEMRSERSASSVHRTRAVILSALEDPSAESEASRAVELAPDSPDAFMVRARVRRRSGKREGALSDVERALSLSPGDPRLLELRGALKTEAGKPEAAIVDFDRAILRGAPSSIRVPRATALMALGNYELAIRDWSLALEDDAEEPEAYIGRATALIRLSQTDRALVDLNQAIDWAAESPALLTRITAKYAFCLGDRPDRLSHWLRLAARTWAAWKAAASARESTATVQAASAASSSH
jgi:Flp pilus assembly protein TadD